MDAGRKLFIRESNSDKFRAVRIAPPGGDSGFDFQSVENWAVVWLPIIFFAILLGDPPDDGPRDAADQAAGDQALVLELRRLGRRGRGGGGQGRAARGGRVHARPQALQGARRARAQGHPAARPSGHRQDAAGQGRGQRVQRDLLRPVGRLVRGDVRGPRRRAHPAAVPPGAQGRPGDRLHRRARRGGRHPRQGHLGREGPDAQPAAGGARRLRRPRRRGRDRRLEHARAARPGAPSPGALRPPDPGHAARPEGPPGDPRRAHRVKAARAGRGPRPDRPPDQRAQRRRPGQHLQRGGDLRRAQPARPRS